MTGLVHYGPWVALLRDTEQLRRLVEREHATRHWGQKRRITPAFVDYVIGEGSPAWLLVFTPLATRPWYYVVRVGEEYPRFRALDDAFGVGALWVDDLEEAIDEQFGPWDEDDPKEWFPRLNYSCGVTWNGGMVSPCELFRTKEAA